MTQNLSKHLKHSVDCVHTMCGLAALQLGDETGANTGQLSQFPLRQLASQPSLSNKDPNGFRTQIHRVFHGHSPNMGFPIGNA